MTRIALESSSPRRGSIFALVVLAGVVLAGTIQGASALAIAPAASIVVALPAGEAENDIDRYWNEVFKDAGLAYNTPELVSFDEPVTTGGCGSADPADFTTFYCEFDDTVYYSVIGIAGEYERFGDAGWLHMMAHEWGHHVQLMLGIIGPGTVSDTVEVELQATCLAGDYVDDAVDRDLVSTDAVEVMRNMFAGDAAHGSRESLLNAFDGGFDGNLPNCGVTFDIE